MKVEVEAYEDKKNIFNYTETCASVQQKKKKKQVRERGGESKGTYYAAVTGVWTVVWHTSFLPRMQHFKELW